MKKIGILTMVVLAIVSSNCKTDKSDPKSENQNTNQAIEESDTLTKHLKPFQADLPTIGLLMYNGVLQREVVATSDVFAKPTEDGKQIFNVITIAQTENPITTEGLRIIPDFTFDNCPKLEALFLPSAK